MTRAAFGTTGNVPEWENGDYPALSWTQALSGTVPVFPVACSESVLLR